MKKIRILGIFFIFLSLITFYPLSITGAFIGVSRVFSFFPPVFFILGLLLIFFSGEKGLEQVVESRDKIDGANEAESKKKRSSFLRKLRNFFYSPIVAGAIAGSTGGYFVGQKIEPYARPIERAYQISQIVGEEVFPIGGGFNRDVYERYLSFLGTEGSKYVENRHSKNNEEYLNRLGNALTLIQETAGKSSRDLIRKTPLEGAQKIHEDLYKQLGKILGVRDLDVRTDRKYEENYSALVSAKLNALIRLHQLNTQIDKNLGSFVGKAANPRENEAALRKISPYLEEANRIYDFLDGKRSLSVDEILKGKNNQSYQRVLDISEEIKEAGYPITSNLPFAGAIAGGVVGAKAGRRVSKFTKKLKRGKK